MLSFSDTDQKTCFLHYNGIKWHFVALKPKLLFFKNKEKSVMLSVLVHMMVH